MKKKIVLAGGSGFLGQGLALYMQRQGYDVVILTRNPKTNKTGVKEVLWDATNKGPWVDEMENAEAIVNLAGKSVNCRYTAENKREIIRSRVESTRVIGEAIGQLKQPPRVWINASSATIYRDSEDINMDEFTGDIDTGFSPEVVKAWEKSFEESRTPATKKFILRISIVLGKEDGIMPRLINLVRFGLGGKQGTGAQFVSWIHEHDFYRVVEWCINNPGKEGVYNCCTPNPVTNYYLMRSMRKAMGMPFGLPAAAWMLRLGALLIGTEPELILKSRRVVPTHLLQQGFVFAFPDIGTAFKNLFSAPPVGGKP